MALIRWEPVRELNTIQSEMNRLFNTFFDSPARPATAAASTLRRWIPPMDLVETEDEFVLRADLPGLSESDVNIELEDNVLTISGERKAEHEERKEGYYRVERASGSVLPVADAARGRRPRRGPGAASTRACSRCGSPSPRQRKPRKVAISVGGEQPSTIEGSESRQQRSRERRRRSGTPLKELERSRPLGARTGLGSINAQRQGARHGVRQGVAFVYTKDRG